MNCSLLRSKNHVYQLIRLILIIAFLTTIFSTTFAVNKVSAQEEQYNQPTGLLEASESPTPTPEDQEYVENEAEPFQSITPSFTATPTVTTRSTPKVLITPSTTPSAEITPFLTFSPEIIPEAEVTEEPRDTTPVKLEIYTNVPDPKSKEFDLLLKLTSTIDSDRVTIKWNLPQYLDSKAKEETYEKIKVGENWFKIRVKPLRKFDDSVSVSAQVFYLEQNKSSLTTQLANVAVDSSLDLQPPTNEYRNIKIMQGIIDIANIGALLAFIGLLLCHAAIRLDRMINPPKYVVTTPQNSAFLESLSKEQS